MSNEEKSDVKNSIRKELLIPGIGLLLAIVGFYYNTNNSLADHKEEISSLKIEIQSKASRDDISDIKQDIHDLQEGNRKILEILIEKQK